MTHGHCFLFVALVMMEIVPRNSGAELKPPVAQKRPHEMVIHGDKRVDDYFWLRQKTNAEVIAYLEAENAYTDGILAPTKPLQEKLYKEILSHLKETDSSAPVKRGEFL